MDNLGDQSNPLYLAETQASTLLRVLNNMSKSTNHHFFSVEDKLINQLFIPKPKGYFALHYYTSNPVNNEKTLQLLPKFLDSEIYFLIQNFAKNFATIRSKLLCLQLDIEALNDNLANFSLPIHLQHKNSQALKNCDDDMEKSDLINFIITKEKTKISAQIEGLRAELNDTEILKFWTDKIQNIRNHLIHTNTSDLDIVYKCALFKYETTAIHYESKVKKDRESKLLKKTKFNEEKAKKELERDSPAIISKAMFEKTLKELDQLKLQITKKDKEPSKMKSSGQKKKKTTIQSKEKQSGNSKTKKSGSTKKAK